MTAAPVTVRVNRRAVWRALQGMTGWVSDRAVLDAVERVRMLPVGFVDMSTDIAVTGRTRRTVTLWER